VGVKLKSGGNLDRERILDEAVALVESDGISELSMRALARRCKASPMALYGHVATKEELLRAVAIRYLNRFEILPGPSDDWRETIKRSVGMMIGAFDEYPFLAEIFAAQHLDAPPILDAFDAILGALRRAGLEDPAAMAGLAAISSYATGYSQRRAGMRQRAEPLPARRKRIRALDPDRFPRIAEHADAFVTFDADQRYEEGLDFILDGLERRASGEASSRSPAAAESR
jgi:AcrR family transcriptional regulator